MRKTHISFMLAAVLTVSAVSGCSNGTSETSAQTTEAVTTAEQTTGSSGEEKETTAEIKGTGGAFDQFTRPRLVEDGKLKFAYIHTKPEVESQTRSLHQAEIEAAHRGWEYIDMVYQEDSEWTDLFLNAMNQDVDAIILGSTESMEAKLDLIAQARNAGIGIYSNDNMIVPGVILNSTMPNGFAAMDLIYTIGEDVGWDAKIGILTMQAIQVHVERTDPISAICGVYTNLEVLETQDTASGGNAPDTFAFDTAKTWFQKYGTEINGVIGSCDFIAMPVAEAAQQSGDLVDPDFWVAGIDGGSTAWTYIRNNTPFKYSYAQPFEVFTHIVFEAMDQIQCKGLNPGDEGCLIENVGEVVYTEGFVVTRENVPEAGQSIHALFDYYGGDPDDAEAWYNWTDAGGAYQIGAGE